MLEMFWGMMCSFLISDIGEGRAQDNVQHWVVYMSEQWCNGQLVTHSLDKDYKHYLGIQSLVSKVMLPQLGCITDYYLNSQITNY